MFLLQGNKQNGFSFDALATCVSSIITNGQVQVKIAKVLKEGATFPSNLEPLQNGQVVLWPEHNIALYNTPAPGPQKPDTNKGILFYSSALYMLSYLNTHKKIAIAHD